MTSKSPHLETKYIYNKKRLKGETLKDFVIFLNAAVLATRRNDIDEVRRLVERGRTVRSVPEYAGEGSNVLLEGHANANIGTFYHKIGSDDGLRKAKFYFQKARSIFES